MHNNSNLITIAQLLINNPHLTNAMVRNDIHNEYTNGLHETGAIVRRTKRSLFIDEAKYMAWCSARSERVEAERQKNKSNSLC